MPMTLYYAPGGISRAVHIALREAGLPFTLEKADPHANTTASGGAYTDVNPGGFVPSLRLENGEILTETIALLPYIADLAPTKKLAPPAGTMERFRLHELLSFIATEVYKLFFAFGDAKDVAAVSAKMQRRLAQLERRQAGRTWLLGDTFGVADAYLFVNLGWAPLVGIDLTPYPNLLAWQARVAARPAVKEAIEVEGPMQH